MLFRSPAGRFLVLERRGLVEKLKVLSFLLYSIICALSFAIYGS